MIKFYNNPESPWIKSGGEDLLKVYTKQLVEKYYKDIETALIDTLTVKLGHIPTRENFRGEIHQVYCHLTQTTTYTHDHTPLFCLTENREMGRIGWLITKFY
jgi:hypothetical protein